MMPGLSAVSEVYGSTVIGSKKKGEYFLPVATRESERTDALFFVEAMPQLACKVTGFYVDGETFPLAEPEDFTPGQTICLEIPQGHGPRAGSPENGWDGSVAGIFASIEVQRGGYPVGTPVTYPKWKLPIGAKVTRERVADKITIAPAATVIVQWYPQVASRLKRFAFEVVGDKNKLFLNELRFGKDSLFLSGVPVPFGVIMEPGTFEIPDVVIPGVLVTASFTNTSSEEMILGGGIVFENVEEELLALHKKYEEEALARVKAATQQTVVENTQGGPTPPGWIEQAQAFGGETK